MGRFADRFGVVYQRWRDDIETFAREGMQFNPTAQQRKAFRIVQAETQLPLRMRKKRLAMRSGQGVGKTTIEVVIALWRCLQGVDALTVVTAPTMVQLRDVWIAESRRLVGAAHPAVQAMVEVTNSKVVICGRPTWGIWTRSASKPENFQGYHQKNLTIIFDECSGIDRAIIQTAKGTLTNPNSLMIAAGNPNTRECAFFDMFYHPDEAPLWHKLRFDSRKSEIVDKDNIQRLIKEFGAESDVVRVRVHGEFPLADPNCIMSSEDLFACQGVPMLDAVAMRGDMEYGRQFGIDFARFGSDESIIYQRSGQAIIAWKRLVKTEPIDVLEAAYKMQRAAGWRDEDCLYCVDAGGMGQGVMGNLYRDGKRVFEFHSNGTSKKRDYANKMTEAYFHIAKIARERRLHIPKDPTLVQQLSSRLYGTNKKGKLEIEGKDEYMKRGPYSSPDRADALAMAFYNAAGHRVRVG